MAIIFRVWGHIPFAWKPLSQLIGRVLIITWYRVLLQRSIFFPGGGSGFIGRYLCKLLTEQNLTPVVVSRITNGRKDFVSWDEIKSNGLPNNVVSVINLAGEQFLSPLIRWNKTLEENIRRSRIDSTTLLKDAIMQAEVPPESFICSSAVGFYPPSETTVYGEDSKPNVADYWHDLCTSWEESGEFPVEYNRVRHVIVRTGIVLQKDGGSLQALLPPFYIGLGGPTGSGKQWFPWVHMDDITGIILHTLQNETAIGIFNGVAPQASTSQDFAKALGSVLNRPSFFSLPECAVKFMFGEPRASMLLDGQNVYPKRILESGYNFKFPTLHSAMKNIIN